MLVSLKGPEKAGSASAEKTSNWIQLLPRGGGRPCQDAEALRTMLTGPGIGLEVHGEQTGRSKSHLLLWPFSPAASA